MREKPKELKIRVKTKNLVRENWLSRGKSRNLSPPPPPPPPHPGGSNPTSSQHGTKVLS